MIDRGRLLGVVPKAFLPNYREFYERRHFTSGEDVAGRTIAVAGHEARFGTDLLFAAGGRAGFTFHVEIVRHSVGAAAASTAAALAALKYCSTCRPATSRSARRRCGGCCAPRKRAASQPTPIPPPAPASSTTDLAWDGQAGIFELGEGLAETERFSDNPEIAAADVDLGRIRQERMRVNTFGDCARATAAARAQFRTVAFDFSPPDEPLVLCRGCVERFPYVPADPAMLEDNCYEAYNIQVQGLAQRLRATGLKLVIGVSGGLDSTQALIVATRAMDRLGLPRTDILGFTLPGFATSEATKANAWRLMQALGVTGGEIDIRPAARQMMTDIGHAASTGDAQYDATY